jgi:hypothetical protein
MSKRGPNSKSDDSEFYLFVATHLTHWRGCDAVHPECVHPAVAILSDLIKELRAQHYADQCECGCEQWYECEPCSHISLCPTQEAAVRAEARLQQITDTSGESSRSGPEE